MDLWWFTPESDIREVITWITDVISCRNAETREKIRAYPRHEMNCSFYLKDHDQFSQAKYYARTTEPDSVEVPWWPYWSEVTDVEAADDTLTITNATDYLSAGDEVIITTGLAYTTHEVLLVNANSVELTAAVGADYASAMVVPVKTVKVRSFNFTRDQGSSVIIASATFMIEYVKSYSANPWPNYLTTTVPEITDESQVNGSVEEGISKRQFLNDGDTGYTDLIDDEKYFRHAQILQFIPFGYTAKRIIRGFLHWMEGRNNIFYLNTWIDETDSEEYTLVRSDSDRIEIIHEDWDTFRVRIPVIEVNDTPEISS